MICGDRFILARFREAEIQNLDSGFRDHDVAGLQIAVDDALFVRLRERSQNLRGIEERSCNRKGSAFEPGGDGFALDQLHDQVVRADIEERADVGVVQRRDRARLALKTGAELLARGLDGHGAAQSSVNGPKNLPHAALSELALDTVRSQAGAHGQCGESRIFE